MHNIEKSKFRKNEYVGHISTGAVRIRRGGSGWTTDTVVPVTARTLKELSQKLEGK